MKLEVGQYVRIQWGNGEQTISKCTNKFDMGDTQYSKNDFYIHTDKKGEVIYKSMILKASHNIIDLIEKNDFVNGHRVIQVDRESLELDIENSMYGCGCETINGDRDIKSIVTKEQFESMAYKVVEE